MAGAPTGVARLLSSYYSPLHGSFLMYLLSRAIAFSELDVKHVPSLQVFFSPLHHSMNIPLSYFSRSVHQNSFLINNMFKTSVKGTHRWEETTYRSLSAPIVVAGH